MKIKDLIKNKYFYVGPIISTIVILGIFTLTHIILNYAEPSLDNYINKEVVSKSNDYINEIELVCKSTPDKEYLLVSFAGSTMEVIVKIDSYNKWDDIYRGKLEKYIELALMRGLYNLALLPLGTEGKEEKRSLVNK